LLAHRCALVSVINAQGLLLDLLASIVVFALSCIYGQNTVLQDLLENGPTLPFPKTVPLKLLLRIFVFVVKHMTYVLSSSLWQSL